MCSAEYHIVLLPVANEQRLVLGTNHVYFVQQWISW